MRSSFIAASAKSVLAFRSCHCPKRCQTTKHATLLFIYACQVQVTNKGKGIDEGNAPYPDNAVVVCMTRQKKNVALEEILPALS